MKSDGIDIKRGDLRQSVTSAQTQTERELTLATSSGVCPRVSKMSTEEGR